jgi:hypothetical protein
VAFDQRIAGFTDQQGTQRVFVGGPTASIYTLAKGTWTRDWTLAPSDDNPPPEMTPVAVADFDGDGVPEIVFHSNYSDSWDDSTLHFSKGKWRHLTAGIHGSTA